MTIVNKKEPILVGGGDIVILFFSLWLALLVRYHVFPTQWLWHVHLVPFSFIFVLSVIVFYAAGLYGRQNVLLIRNKLPMMLIKSQLLNMFLAVLLFYFIPAFTVTPKINLFLYFALSTCFLILWRFSVFPLLRLRRRQNAMVIGSGVELEELVNEMNHGSRSAIEATTVIDLDHVNGTDIHKLLSEKIANNAISHILLDLHHEKITPLLPELYRTLFLNVSYTDIYVFYEEIFGRIPLSCMSYAWVLENITPSSTRLYDAVKRLADIALSSVVGLFALLFYPFVALAIYIEDKGPVFITQKRVGKNGKIFDIVKYRSMKVNDGGVWPTENDDRITRVGRFIRKTRIDEFAQAWSIFRGDQSIVGPRPDIIDLGKQLEEQIPYYSTRTIVKPGISGWAQVSQEKPPHSLEETKVRLSYDLYYIKNRSLMLDFRIVLHTLKTLLSRAGA